MIPYVITLREFLEGGADHDEEESPCSRDDRLDELLSRSIAAWHDLSPEQDVPTTPAEAAKLKMCLLFLWDASRRAEKDQKTPTSREDWIGMLGLELSSR